MLVTRHDEAGVHVSAGLCVDAATISRWYAKQSRTPKRAGSLGRNVPVYHGSS